ncbi:cation:dicarboxylase symporter family transporter [Arthrobacter sp. UM1]|nr:cation:dicarboxylase symporter family transporter [Arthrobacter sp. UM1]MCB4208053.1 cation:dicarboxylase symporter family transporter [Arthrobacter sp. UM1]
MSATPLAPAPPKARKDRTHWLYIGVIIGVLAGIAVGFFFPPLGKELKHLGDLFVDLIKMMISPVIFCTIVLGIGSLRSASTVGKAGGIALTYFLVMSTFALGIGVVVGNLIHPGTGLHAPAGAVDKYASQAEHAGGGWDFFSSLIPTSLFSALTEGKVLQTLLVALLVGFALQQMGQKGQPALDAIAVLQKAVFKILTMILWLAPIGAFGAMAGVVASTGLKAVLSLLTLMVGFYITCILFVVVVLGLVLKAVTGVSVFRLLKFLGREFLLIVATSSSESALPNLMAKMQHLGVDKSTVGVVVPTGYSFNLDGTAIYLTMASIFVANALGQPMDLGQQLGLIVFMIIASKGAAGVTGAGLATLAAGLQSHAPQLVSGVGIIVGIDRFMSEARALTNFAGNAVATLVVGRWTRTVDFGRVEDVLSGRIPFDQSSLDGDVHGGIGFPVSPMATNGDAAVSPAAEPGAAAPGR